MTHFNHLLDDVMRTHAGAPMALEVARELARLTTDASDDERQALQQAAQARGLYVQQPGESDDDTLCAATAAPAAALGTPRPQTLSQLQLADAAVMPATERFFVAGAPVPTTTAGTSCGWRRCCATTGCRAAPAE